jgi:hypothetical protein
MRSTRDRCMYLHQSSWLGSSEINLLTIVYLDASARLVVYFVHKTGQIGSQIHPMLRCTSAQPELSPLELGTD